MNWIVVLIVSIIVTGISVWASIEKLSDLGFFVGMLAFWFQSYLWRLLLPVCSKHHKALTILPARKPTLKRTKRKTLLRTRH